MSLDRKEIRRAFSRAAIKYDQFAVLQTEVRARLFERLDYLDQAPTRVLDLGSGTGVACAMMRKRWPKAHIIALDLAQPMLRAAKKHGSFWRPLPRVNADAEQLPFADQSFDLVFSNLCLQWCSHLPQLFDELRRVLKPKAWLMFSTFGPDTLHELRSSWAAVDNKPHVNQFFEMQKIGDAMLSSGLSNPVLDLDFFTLTYDHPKTLMQELKAIGAHNADQNRARGLTGKQHYQAMCQAYEAHRSEGVLPASYEVIYAQAQEPGPNQPRRSSGNDVASFSIDQLRGSRIKRD